MGPRLLKPQTLNDPANQGGGVFTSKMFAINGCFHRFADMNDGIDGLFASIDFCHGLPCIQFWLGGVNLKDFRMYPFI